MLHPIFLISRMQLFFQYHKNETMCCLMHCGVCIYILQLMILMNITIFKYSLLSRRPDITMLWMILLCLSFFSLSHVTSPPVVSIDMLKSSTTKLVIPIDSDKATSSSTLMHIHGCFSLFYGIKTKLIIITGDLFYAVWITHIILFFARTTASMELKPHTEVTSWREKFMWISYLGWRLVVSTVVPLGKLFIFAV